MPISENGAKTELKALLTHRSIGPSSFSIRSAASSTAAKSATSTSRGSGVPPASRTSSAAPARPSSPRASSATASPPAASRRATARPMPPLAPVTTEIFVMADEVPRIAAAEASGLRLAEAPRLDGDGEHRPAARRIGVRPHGQAIRDRERADHVALNVPLHVEPVPGDLDTRKRAPGVAVLVVGHDVAAARRDPGDANWEVVVIGHGHGQVPRTPGFQRPVEIRSRAQRQLDRRARGLPPRAPPPPPAPPPRPPPR